MNVLEAMEKLGALRQKKMLAMSTLSTPHQKVGGLITVHMSQKVYDEFEAHLERQVSEWNTSIEELEALLENIEVYR